MKVSIECAHCLLQRAVNQVKLATDDPELQMDVITAMTRFLADNLTADSVPSHIGTDRDLLVQRMTGKDPYADLKRQSNRIALELLPDLLRIVEESGDDAARFRRAALIAAAANAIEFDVSGRHFGLDELRGILDRVEHDLAIDQVDEFRELCRNADEVLYLMDNAGEIVLDIVLISEIRRLGPRVIAYVKGGPVLNDATMDDAEEVGLANYADEVRDTGAPAIGVNPERNSKEFLDAFFSAQLIVAKGMGNYESLTEFDPTCPVVHVMRTKCDTVAKHVGVPRNKNVVLIRKPPTA
ncbi:MAG: ARMT1-like domain-containing protein [Candidatus Thorarchaeota archaeon]|nr:ARMT1-like domain-containing protein [Candidatus Thorarchaeota archaeon]